MTEISKADYLKKYLGGASSDKKKKKKKDKINKESRFKIIETDAFATVAGNDYEDEDSDNDLEIQMINEAIKSKMKKGGMKGAFKSTFQTIDGPEIKEEPLDEEEIKKEPPQVKEEVEETSETKMAFKMAMKGSKSESLRDQSPPRRKRHDSPDQSPPRRRQRHDSDQSPPRTSTRQRAASPVRRKRHDSQSPPRRRQRHDSDNSPLRKRRQDTPDQSPPRRKRHDSDQSPPRQRRQRHDSDQSPPRNARKRRDSDQSPPRKRRVASPEIDSKAKTLDGKTAGLQNARDLKAESDKIRARESKLFDEMDAAVSGRDAETRIREKQTKKGRKGEDKEDKEKKEREARKQLELEEKYKEWNKGMKQMKDRQEQLEEMARVVAGPMTRTAEDVDMNKFMKERVLEGDPMAAFIVKKKREEAIDRGDLVYPTYDKPFPPNRYGIRPGYRWDGVDRSNGFESKLSLSQNARQAKEREMYSNSNVFE